MITAISPKDLVNHPYSPGFLLDTLYQAMDYVVQNKERYVYNPGKDFTRSRKMDLRSLMEFLVRMEAGDIGSEITRFYPSGADKISNSGYVQQRDKLRPEAMRDLLARFTELLDGRDILMDGYYVLAVDGSDVNVSPDPSDKETYVARTGGRGYSQFHVNAMYDVLNHQYRGVSIDSASKKNERGSLMRMLDEGLFPRNSIIVTDRGYEGYDYFGKSVSTCQKILARVKDIGSNGILSGKGLPDCEFDMDVTFRLTRRQTKQMKADRSITILPANVACAMLDECEGDILEMTLRVVRFRLDGGEYECIVTNLPREEFPAERVKQIYWLRWICEGAFRKLKYNISLVFTHARKREAVKMEIYARLVMYNFCARMTSNAAEIKADIDRRGEKKKGRMHCYSIDFSTAVTEARGFLREKPQSDIGVIANLFKNMVASPPGRKFDRNIAPQKFKIFSHRSC